MSEESRFSQWMIDVDAAIGSICGLSYWDLADQQYRYQYEDGYTPRQAAIEALEAEGLDVYLLESYQ